MVDLTCSKRKAFRAGFWRGLASPLVVYSTVTLPAAATPQVQEVQNPAKRTDGLRGDWKRVGQHLRSAAAAEALKHG